jgi:serine/threonine-protein kinase HipA
MASCGLTPLGGRCHRPSTLTRTPEPGPVRLATSVDGRTDEAGLDVALKVAELFRLVDRDARAIVRGVAAATAAWRTVAVGVSLPDREIERMARAFEHDQLAYAQTL